METELHSTNASELPVKTTRCAVETVLRVGQSTLCYRLSAEHMMSLGFTREPSAILTFFKKQALVLALPCAGAMLLFREVSTDEKGAPAH
jgi:hypothetical protein